MSALMSQKSILAFMLLSIPLSGMGIDIYTPSLPTLVYVFNTSSSLVKLTLPLYFLGFSGGQLFSFGGYIAQEMAKQAPHKVSRLILMNTCGGESSKKQQQTRHEFIDLCRKNGTHFALNAFLNKINSSYYDNKDIVSIISEMVKEIKENIFIRQFKSVYNYNINPPNLLNIRCETLIISSTDDPFISKEACRELADTIPRNKIKILEGGGHMLPLSKPDEINSLMKDFFRYYSM